MFLSCEKKSRDLTKHSFGILHSQTLSCINADFIISTVDKKNDERSQKQLVEFISVPDLSSQHPASESLGTSESHDL